MNSKNHFDRIEEYLTGDLTEQEMSAFENELKTDTDLQNNVDKHMMAHDAVELMIENSLREDFKQWRKEELANDKNEMPQIGRRSTLRVRRMTRVYAIAASVVLLLGVGLWNILGTGGFSNEEFAATYYESPDYSKFRSSGDISDQASGMDREAAFDAGVEALEANELEKAIDSFSQIPSSSPGYEQAQFFLGHSYYLSKDYEKAANAFKVAANGNDAKVKEDAQAALLINWIASDQKGAEFNALLNKIAEDEGHSFEEEAKEIINKLK